VQAESNRANLFAEIAEGSLYGRKYTDFIVKQFTAETFLSRKPALFFHSVPQNDPFDPRKNSLAAERGILRGTSLFF
jgi:hypothetical protein